MIHAFDIYVLLTRVLSLAAILGLVALFLYAILKAPKL